MRRSAPCCARAASLLRGHSAPLRCMFRGARLCAYCQRRAALAGLCTLSSRGMRQIMASSSDEVRPPRAVGDRWCHAISVLHLPSRLNKQGANQRAQLTQSLSPRFDSDAFQSALGARG